MSDVGDYLMKNYYSKYRGDRTDIIPDAETLERGLAQHTDKIIVIREDGIRGVGIFVTLSDETYTRIQQIDVTQVDVLIKLLQESGPNVHFVLLCADGLHTILAGIREVINRVNPKTISWFDPDLKRLHRHKIE